VVPEGGEVFNYCASQQSADDNLDKKINLTNDQVDQIWIELIEYLLKYQLFEFAEKIMGNLNDKETQKVKYFNAQIQYMKGNLDAAIEQLDDMLNTHPKNTDYLITKANYCFVAQKFYEAEETFLKAFKLKGNVKTFPTYLRLGYIFLSRKAWGDAHAVLANSCQMKPNSSISWLGLGIACFRSQIYSEGEQALNQANLYDPLNSEIWGYMALLSLYDNRTVQAHQCLREMLKCEIKNNTLLEEIADKLNTFGKNEDSRTLYKKILENYQVDHSAV
jgi:tetratricopeptide (TPR) repeat protein